MAEAEIVGAVVLRRIAPCVGAWCVGVVVHCGGVVDSHPLAFCRHS